MLWTVVQYSTFAFLHTHTLLQVFAYSSRYTTTILSHTTTNEHKTEQKKNQQQLFTRTYGIWCEPASAMNRNRKKNWQLIAQIPTTRLRMLSLSSSWSSLPSTQLVT